jgi:hypothetical protein
VVGVSVAQIGSSPGVDVPGTVLLDLILAPDPASPADGRIRCVRLASTDLALPQLQAEPSPFRAAQRLAATILKVSGATPYPDRDSCVGRLPAASYVDLPAYEADLLARLQTIPPSATSR